MQNNEVRGKSGGFQLAKYRWLVIFAGAVLAGVVYVSCKPPDGRVSTKDLVYEPLGNTWVDDWQGNGDGEINPGEQVKVKPRLRNTGKQGLPAFDLVISTSEPKVALQDNKCHYPASEPGQTILAEDPFEFKLDASFVGHWVSFTSRIDSTAKAGFVKAGFVNDAFASNGNPPPIVLAVVSNYNLCVGACTLRRNNNDPVNDILTINLELCNGATTNPPTNPPGPTLTNPSVKIVTNSLKAFKTPIPVTETIVVMDNDLSYDNVTPGTCAQPELAVPPNLEFFEFKVPKSWFNLATPPTASIHFTAEIYSGPTYQGTAYVGIKATLLQ